MNDEAKRGQAPQDVDRVDKGRGDFEKDHVHFKDGSALNNDGTWKHRKRDLTNKEKKWLDKHNWKLPSD